jgi:prepilin-type N-terminal cleavage/methylation domain-containing protein
MESLGASRQFLSLHAQDGFTMIEVMIAAFVLTAGLLGLLGTFDSARKLTLLTERRSAIAHHAQLEVERLQTVEYSKLATNAAPTHSSVPSNPNYYVQPGGTEYQWEQSNGQSSTSSNTDKLVTEGTGIFEPTATTTACPTTPEATRSDPCTWSSSPLSGSLYYFVSVAKDGVCAKAPCPKRLTVVVTVNVPAGTRAVAPALVTTIISP